MGEKLNKQSLLIPVYYFEDENGYIILDKEEMKKIVIERGDGEDVNLWVNQFPEDYEEMKKIKQ